MKHLHRQGVALAYEEAGSGAPPLVLVHDLGADHTSLAPQFEYFSARHRVVAVDLRGHGQSNEQDQSCTVALLADDLAWLCYELALYMPVVIGHGRGGEVALDLAARYAGLAAAVVVLAESSLPTPPTPHQQPAVSRLESGSPWDRIAVAGESSVPVLYVAPGASEATGDRQRLRGVRLGVLEWGAAQREDTAVPEQVNRLVDSFLLDLAGRAPP